MKDPEFLKITLKWLPASRCHLQNTLQYLKTFWMFWWSKVHFLLGSLKFPVILLQVKSLYVYTDFMQKNVIAPKRSHNYAFNTSSQTLSRFFENMILLLYFTLCAFKERLFLHVTLISPEISMCFMKSRYKYILRLSGIT